MPQLIELRQGRTRHAGPIAGASVFVLVTGGGWVAWQLMQGDESTLRQSQFETWLIGLAIGTTVVALLGATFWTGRNVRLGVAAGLALAAVAMLLGLLNDVLTSMS